MHKIGNINASVLSSAVGFLNLHTSDHTKYKPTKIVKLFYNEPYRLLELNPKGMASTNVDEDDLKNVEAYLSLQPHAEVKSDGGGNEASLFRPVSMVDMSKLADIQDFDDETKKKSNKYLFMDLILLTEVTSTSRNNDYGSAVGDMFLLYDNEEDK